MKPGESFPEIRRIDDWTVEIDGEIVSFDGNTGSDARIIIDVKAIRGKQPGLR